MNLDGINATWVGSLQSLRGAGGAVVLGALWIAESIAPLYVGRTRRLSHDLSNLTLAALNLPVAAALAGLLFAVADSAQRVQAGLLHWLPVSSALQWVLAFLLLDAWQYAWHRLNHAVPWLWRFHAVHHADAELDATSGIRFHLGELIASFLARLAILPVLGITAPQLILYEAVSLPFVLFQHANLRLPSRLDAVLSVLLVTPNMHVVHHSRWQPETDSNFSSVFSFWDKLFGSYRHHPRPWEIQLGLDDWPVAAWRTVRGMWTAPWKRSGGAFGRQSIISGQPTDLSSRRDDSQ